MDLTAALAPPSSIDQDLAHLRGMQKDGRHEEALGFVQDLLLPDPDNRDLLLAAAISQRHLQHIPEALDTLDALERTQPWFSRLHQERGLCYVGLKDAPRAIESLLRAVNINPALTASWRMLNGLYLMTEDRANAATAAEHVEILKALPPEVVAATSLFSDGDLAEAEKLVRAFLLRHGDHAEGMRLLARIGIAQDALDDAQYLLEAVLELEPGYQAARHDYGQVLIKRQMYREADEQARRLLEQEPGNLDFRALDATAAVGLGHHERAIGIYRALIEDAPGSWDVPLWMGHALKTVGRTAEAINSYRGAAAARANFGDAYWSLANLKTYRFGDDEIAGMREQEALPATPPVDRYHLCFALGKAFEDRGELALSWTYYERGNALKRAESRYRPEIIETNTRQQIAVCTADFLARRTGWGDPRPDPIFIGLPRSGSTLIEQILASHSQVEGTQELPDIQAIVVDLQGRDPDLDHPRYPGALADLSREQVLALGGRYLDSTRVYRTGGAPLFIDKMPNNFRHVGLIHLMLPNARIIDARREPMACCFSNLKQLFAQGQEFTYSPEDIARYYRTYLELMRHWDQVLPGRVLRVQHEDVVDGLEGQVRRILDYCGLPFEDACVDFHKNKRSVRTPSSEQVRQPIFRDSLDQWTRFEPWLEPLKAALGEARTAYRD